MRYSARRPDRSRAPRITSGLTPRGAEGPSSNDLRRIVERRSLHSASLRRGGTPRLSGRRSNRGGRRWRPHATLHDGFSSFSGVFFRFVFLCLTPTLSTTHDFTVHALFLA